jgi:cardiolipin synthase
MSKSSKHRARDAAVTALAAFGAGALALHGSRLLLQLFGPPLPYRLNDRPPEPLDSADFIEYLSLITDAAAHRKTTVQRLKNAGEFYPAELECIRNAQSSVNLECYAFLKGEVADQFLAALTERARAGVDVRLVVDSLGSFSTGDRYFAGLQEAGGRIEWYHPVNFKSWPRANNRTHRKILLVDGRVAFVGGAGVADHWLTGTRSSPPWRDTMFRLEGQAVMGVTSVFAENWLECTGEILAGERQFPFETAAGDAPVLVVNSSPQSGGTRARILFQTLLDSARETIRITSPYFLPDRSARHAIVRAVQDRGVDVQVITAGRRSDHPWAVKLSEFMDVEVVHAGAQLYEYDAAMIHAKLMTVDGMWTVFGSTNFDHRSFALNHEINVALLDRDLASRVDGDFREDLDSCRRVTLDELRHRSVSTRIIDRLSWVARREE